MKPNNSKNSTKIDNPTLLYCALDNKEPETVENLAIKLSGSVDGFKLGLEYFCHNGPAGINRIKNIGLPLFLDLKLHDIPNTVAEAVRSVAPLSPKYLTVHASGGTEMIKAAISATHEEADRLGTPRIRLLAVTILTSLSPLDLISMGIGSTTKDAVAKLTTLAAEVGIDGLVCSPEEISIVRKEVGIHKEIFVPGIRPEGSMKNDQKRSATPRQAANDGATALVVGRPITGAVNPSQSAKKIKDEIGFKSF